MTNIIKYSELKHRNRTHGTIELEPIMAPFPPDLPIVCALLVPFLSITLEEYADWSRDYSHERDLNEVWHECFDAAAVGFGYIDKTGSSIETIISLQDKSIGWFNLSKLYTRLVSSLLTAVRCEGFYIQVKLDVDTTAAEKKELEKALRIIKHPKVVYDVKA